VSQNLKARVRTVVADRLAESDSEAVSEATVKAVLSGNAGVEPLDVEAALAELVEGGTLVETEEGYRPADGSDE